MCPIEDGCKPRRQTLQVAVNGCCVTPRQVVGLRASHDPVDLAVMVEPAQFGQHATRSCCGRIQEARLQLPEPGIPVLTFPIQRFDAKFPAPLVGVVFQPIEFCECRVPLFRGETVVLPPVLGSRSNFTCAPDKPRHVILAEEGQTFFETMTAGRPDDAPIFQRENGGRWGKSHQARPLREACKRARIKPASFHVLRHTYASLLVMNGATLQVVASNLGHSDTRMVEKHYVHLQPSYVADMIRAATPNLGIADEGNIKALRPQAL